MTAYAFGDPVFYRSGEWMTTNIARKNEVPVRFVELAAA